ncbi:MAG: hypothetical protein ACE366_20375 [Bradymonadia bacterium]
MCALVAFVEKNIDRSRSAKRELNRKATKAGVKRGMIPTFDVGGDFFVGFDKSRLLRAVYQ